MSRFSISRRLVLFITVAALAAGSISCTLSLADLGGLYPQPLTPTPGLVIPAPTPIPQAQVTFQVALSQPLAAGQGITLAILDEVTGLALNAQQVSMQAADSTRYTVTLPVAMGSVVKYRYLRSGGALIQEDTPLDQLVRYRMYHVTGPGVVEDSISSWSDQPFNAPSGRLDGILINADTGAPLPGILVAAAGQHTLTDSQGYFLLESVVPGTHMITAYALNGAYGPYQQGALVLAGQVTTARMALKPAALVNVTFLASMPPNTIPGAPVRLAGNLLQLGNTFGDLNGGMSVITSRMPTLTPQPDGRYALTLRLPVGADIRYKYSLGDGFWNAEHDANGDFVVRQLIVPAQDVTVQDAVVRWEGHGPSASILFELTAPDNTPPGDTVSIQLNPYGWTEPIPMWALGNNRWVYKLFGPFNLVNTFSYRFCRNDQCGSADDASTTGLNPGGRRITVSLAPQDFQDTIPAWHWMQDVEAPVIPDIARPRGEGFWAGVEFQAYYHPSFQTLYFPAIQNVQALRANWLTITPTWTIQRTDPFLFSPVPGKDPLWQDTGATLGQARAQGLNVAVFPDVRLPQGQTAFWNNAPRTPEWWNLWFNRYRAFAINYADLAGQNGAQVLVLGGDWVAPALPGAPGAPADAELRWRSVLDEVRGRYGGQVYWALPYTTSPLNAPLFLDAVDGYYLLWRMPIAAQSGASVDAMAVEAGRLMDADLLPLLQRVNKPMVIAFAYPSASGVATNCIPSSGGCLGWEVLSRPNADVPDVGIDLNGQANAYQAVLRAINDRVWVGGVVSQGYYPPAALMDKSASIHGKRAADHLWYWFTRFRNLP